MKLIVGIVAIVAASTAGRIFDSENPIRITSSLGQYHSGLEQHDLQSIQSEAYTKQNSYRDDSGDKNAKILEHHQENDGHTYKYAYETDNGIKAGEVGEIAGKGTAAQGAYSYKGDDGKVYTVSYTADEHGFRPTGDHLPTPPPVPEAILKSLEQNAHAEANGVFDDGKYHEQKHEEDLQHLQYQGQQYDAGQQAMEYQHSGAELAYHGQSHGSEYSQQSGNEHSQSNLAYLPVPPSVYSGGNSGFYPSHSQISLGQQVSSGHATSYNQQGSGYEANLQTSFLPLTDYASENSGHSGRSYLPPSSYSGYHRK